jgi:hypothetical protein
MEQITVNTVDDAFTNTKVLTVVRTRMVIISHKSIHEAVAVPALVLFA